MNSAKLQHIMCKDINKNFYKKGEHLNFAPSAIILAIGATLVASLRRASIVSSWMTLSPISFRLDFQVDDAIAGAEEKEGYI